MSAGCFSADHYAVTRRALVHSHRGYGTRFFPRIIYDDGKRNAIERDPSAGVKLACDLVEGVRASGAFDGVHLIPVSRYREVAARLESRR